MLLQLDSRDECVSPAGSCIFLVRVVGFIRKWPAYLLFAFGRQDSSVLCLRYCCGIVGIDLGGVASNSLVRVWSSQVRDIASMGQDMCDGRR